MNIAFHYYLQSTVHLEMGIKPNTKVPGTCSVQSVYHFGSVPV